MMSLRKYYISGTDIEGGGNYFIYGEKMQAEHIIYYLIGINIITFLMYGSDKHFSKRSMYRVPEKTLLLAALLGGTPAAFIAQKIFRHKTKKGKFQMRFWMVVVIQVAAIVYYFTKHPHAF